MKKIYLLIIFSGVIVLTSFVFKNELGNLRALLTTDTRIPFQPYNLRATVSYYNQIDLVWTDDSSNQTSSITVTGFKVWRKESFAGTWSLLKTTTSPTYTDLNMSPGSYEYKVNACNDNGCSADSQIITASFSKDTTPPTMPDNFSIPVKEVTDTKAILYWSGSTDDLGLKSYNIYRSTGSGNNFAFIASVSSSQTTYTDNTLSPVTNYYYQVKSMDLARNESISSSTINIVTLTLNSGSQYVRVTYPNNGECFTLPGNLHVAWTGSNLNQSALYFNNTRIFLGPGTIYDFYMTASVSETAGGSIKVVSVDGNGNEGISDVNDKPFIISKDCNKEVQVPSGIPAIPSYTRASLVAGKTDINLNWQDNSTNETEFRVYRRKLPDGQWQMLVKLGANVTTYTDPGVAPGDYEYDTNACNVSGCSTYSNQARITAVTSLPLQIYSVSDLKQGDMVSATNSDDPDVYIINDSGYKRLFLNPVIFSFYGHLGGFQNIKNIASTTRDTYKTSGLFQNCENGDPKVYGLEITGEDIATLHWINTTGEKAVADDPDFFKKVFCINNAEFDWYQKGSDFSSVSQVPEYGR